MKTSSHCMIVYLIQSISISYLFLICHKAVEEGCLTKDYLGAMIWKKPETIIVVGVTNWAFLHVYRLK